MKHSITELYTLYNVYPSIKKIATREYCEANNIPCYEKTPETYEERQAGYARPCVSYVNNSNKGFNVLDVNGKKKIYLFDEKTWFDTFKELEEYRKQYQHEQIQQTLRNSVKKEIIAILDGMELKDLEILLSKLS